MRPWPIAQSNVCARPASWPSQARQGLTATGLPPPQAPVARIGMGVAKYATSGLMAACISMNPVTSVRKEGSTSSSAAMTCPPGLTVLYDGSCPLCRREISVYRGAHASQPLNFKDVSDPALVPPTGTGVETLMARFHVQHADGRLESGARAFIALWALLPGWRWLARLGRLPGMTPLMEWAYQGFLRVRPAFQALARRWDRQAEPAVASTLPHDLLRELRTDHAGETGAVMIYRGVLAVTRDPALRAFAEHHLDTERRHLAQIELVMPRRERIRLLPLWRVSGWVTGALPACAGPRAVYATIQTVETFVDRHYADQVRQIDALLGAQPGAEPSEPLTAMVCELHNLRAVLEECRLDEVAHRDDAAQRWDGRASAWLRLWQGMAGRGSAWAVALCRRL